MRVVRSFVMLVFLLTLYGTGARAQGASRLETILGISGRQRSAAPLLAPQGLQDHVVNGKLVLTLDDSIRLALSTNTDIHLDYYQVETAQDNLARMYAPF